MAIMVQESLPKKLSLSMQPVSTRSSYQACLQGYAVSHSCLYTWCSHLLVRYSLTRY